MAWKSFRFSSWDKVITALPCVTRLTDSKMATPLAPMFPLGVTPRPPMSPAHKSLKKTQPSNKKTHKFFHIQLPLCKVLQYFCLSINCNYNLIYTPAQSQNNMEKEQMLLATCTPSEHWKILRTTSRKQCNKGKLKGNSKY